MVYQVAATHIDILYRGMSIPIFYYISILSPSPISKGCLCDMYGLWQSVHIVLRKETVKSVFFFFYLFVCVCLVCVCVCVYVCMCVLLWVCLCVCVCVCVCVCGLSVCLYSCAQLLHSSKEDTSRFIWMLSSYSQQGGISSRQAHKNARFIRACAA